MHMQNTIAKHAEKSACEKTHAAGTGAAEQADSLLGSRGFSASRALHVRARGMACCMIVASGMKNAACMQKCRHGSESEAESLNA